MSKQYTDVTLLLDKSGSMQSTVGETIKAFNLFLEEQAKSEFNVDLTLIQFDAPGVTQLVWPISSQALYKDDWYEVIYQEKNSKVAPKLSYENYKPRGNTALNDAICIAIDETGKRLAAKKEEDRPNKVLFVILTDGQENSSNVFRKEHVAEKQAHQTDKYNWTFLFMGNDQEVVKQAFEYGLSAGNTLNYRNRIFYAVQALGSGMACYNASREERTLGFFDAVR